MADYCVKNNSGKVVAVYTGEIPDEKKQWQAEQAALSGHYGAGCSVAVHVASEDPTPATAKVPAVK